jgi:uncharacterized membrane protein YhaH (DUF805 family)
MKRYYFHGEDEQSHGPLEEVEIKSLYEAGKLTKDTYVIEEGAENWLKYEKLFWTPPPLVRNPPPVVASPPPLVANPPPQVASPPPPIASPPPPVASPPPLVASPPSQVTSPPSQVTSPLQNSTNSYLKWTEAFYAAKCPSCSAIFKIKGNGLTKRRFTCPFCFNVHKVRSLKEIELIEEQNIIHNRITTMMNYHGRVGRLEYLLFFLVPPFLISLAGTESGAHVWALLWMLVFGMPTAVKRLQDLGYSRNWMWIPMSGVVIPWLITGNFFGETFDAILGILWLVLLIPSIIIFIMMLALGSKSQTNLHGPPACQTKRVWR